MRYVLCVLFCFLAQAEQPELVVQTGAPFTVSIPLPSLEARQPFKAYLASLSVNRPLPWPFLLEGVVVEGGLARLTGRMMESGVYTVPLGTFTWGQQTFDLPSFRITATVPNLPGVDIQDLMLPFPDSLVEPSQANQELQSALSSRVQQGSLLAVGWRDVAKNCFYIALLCCALLPLVRRVVRVPIAVASPPVVTPAMRLRFIRAQVAEGKVPWSELLAFLNGVGEGTPLTAFELKQYFSCRRENSLAQAAQLIEMYGYTKGGDERFGEALDYACRMHRDHA